MPVFFDIKCLRLMGEGQKCSLRATSIKTRIKTGSGLPGQNPKKYRLRATSIKTRIKTPDTWGRKRAALVALSIAVFYAMTDEFHQSFIPNRTPALFDVGVDAAGSVLGLMIYGSARWFFEGKEA